MKKASAVITACTWAAAFVPVVVMAVVFSRIPAVVPSHYNAAGAADQFLSKWNPAVLALSTIGLFGAAFMSLLSAALTRRLAHSAAAARVMKLITLAVTLLFTLLGILLVTGLVQ